MNSVNLVGRLTKDIELKKTDGDFAYSRYSIAVQRQFKNKSGEYEADFINCVSFGKTAEFLEKYFAKGQWIGITGRVQSRKWDENGTTRYGMEIVADSVFFTSEKKGGANNTNSAEHAGNSTFEPSSNPIFDANADDLPF